MHQTMLADAAPDPATNNVPASNPPNKTLLNLISLRSLLRTESLTESTHRVDQPRATILLQFLPNSRDMHLQRVRLRPGRHSPHCFGDLRACDELTAAAHHRRNDPKF